MKTKLKLSIALIFLVITLMSIVYGAGENITVVTSKDALQAISESESIIAEMQANNFSTVYMNDNLIEAKIVFGQAQYASILRDSNSTESEKQKARTALKLVNWKEITYEDVLVYTEEIKTRKETAFLLSDEISVAELKLPSASEATKKILENARIAFSEERYNDAEKLILEFNAAVEQENAQASLLAGMRKGAKNFFQRYWIQILVLLIAAIVAGYFTYKKLEKKMTANRIKKMKIEETVLNGLMKKTQEERFKENKISGLVYNIRMKKYQERLQEIKEELPVLEDRLKDLKTKKT